MQNSSREFILIHKKILLQNMTAVLKFLLYRAGGLTGLFSTRQKGKEVRR